MSKNGKRTLTRKEYRFDYSKARPNRFAMRKKERLIVILDPDVSQVFKTPEAVNGLLRALIATMPPTKVTSRGQATHHKGL